MPKKYERLGTSVGIPSRGGHGAYDRYQRMRPVAPEGHPPTTEQDTKESRKVKLSPSKVEQKVVQRPLPILGNGQGSGQGSLDQQPQKDPKDGWKGIKRSLFDDKITRR